MADVTELADEELDEVSGGAFSFIKAIVYSGTTTAAAAPEPTRAPRPPTRRFGSSARPEAGR